MFNMHTFAFFFRQVGLNKLSKKGLPSSLCVGTIQFVEILNRTSRRWKGTFSLSLHEPGCSDSSAFGHQNSWFSGCWTQDLYQQAPGSQTLHLRMNYASRFSGSSTCRCHILAYLNLHNHHESISIINLPLSLLSLSYWFCFSEELWLVYIVFLVRKLKPANSSNTYTTSESFLGTSGKFFLEN